MLQTLSDRKIAWLLFALAAVVYAATMCRTIYTGDDGDFETAMYTLGICHPTGYPLFRLEWQALGSLQRRLRNCFTGVRAEPFTTGASEWIDLEIYLRERAAGMASDAPAVRP